MTTRLSGHISIQGVWLGLIGVKSLLVITRQLDSIGQLQFASSHVLNMGYCEVPTGIKPMTSQIPDGTP